MPPSGASTTSLVAQQRLKNQQIVSPQVRTTPDLLRSMGAVQAQDYAASLWAMGLRLPTAVAKDVEKAITDRAIVRTWPMRGTLHFVPAEDVHWMLGLLASRMIALGAGRRRELELDTAAFARSRRILERHLEGGRQLTRPAAYAALAGAGVSPLGQCGIHILGQLAHEGVLCFGPWEGRQPTFVLLEKWAPKPKSLPSRDEALALLAGRYFQSHGPASVHDFAWWSSLLLKDAERAMAAAGLRTPRAPEAAP